MLGILGGMGPLATVDLMQKIIHCTLAETDQDHIPVLALSDCKIPDRRAAILNQSGKAPLSQMISGVQLLEKAGAQCIVIACGTAHYWLADLRLATSTPIISMIDAVCEVLHRDFGTCRRVGVLATHALISSCIYQEHLSLAGFEPIVLTAENTNKTVESAIRQVKRGSISAARQDLQNAINKIFDHGAQVVVLACTELPIAFSPEKNVGRFFVDASTALAESAVRWYSPEKLSPFSFDTQFD
jgi:aspartate racemase